MAEARQFSVADAARICRVTGVARHRATLVQRALDAFALPDHGGHGKAAGVADLAAKGPGQDGLRPSDLPISPLERRSSPQRRVCRKMAHLARGEAG
jgi:hypothetical protein